MHPTERADRLTQVRQELAIARKAREQYDQWATEAQDESYAQTSEQARHAWVMQATRYRAQAVIYAKTVHELVKQVEALEAGPALVVVTAEQAADMDDTFSYAGAAA